MAATCSTPQEGARSKVCAVCKCDSESYHLNYGASTCFSCRAFFRRAVQKGKYVGGGDVTSYVCKDSSDCPVTLVTRRRCQRCRFLACVAAGMRPEAVMDEEGKRSWFRKAIKKQRAALDTGEAEGGGEEGELRLSFGSRRQKITQSGGSSAGASNSPDVSSGSNSSNETGRGLLSPDAGAASGLDVECAMTERLQHLKSTWESALRETVFDEEARDAILSFHCSLHRRPPRMQAAINREIFARHLGWESVYKRHARLQPEFQEMSEPEQKEVLRRNGPLFLQYILSGYFGAASAEEQLDWIFLRKLPRLPPPGERPRQQEGGGPVHEAVLTRALGVSAAYCTALPRPTGASSDHVDLDSIHVFSGLSLFLGSTAQHNSVLAMADWIQERLGIGGGSNSFIALSDILNNAATHWQMQ